MENTADLMGSEDEKKNTVDDMAKLLGILNTDKSLCDAMRNYAIGHSAPKIPARKQ
jgi:hypothetical protein